MTKLRLATPPTIYEPSMKHGHCQGEYTLLQMIEIVIKEFYAIPPAQRLLKLAQRLERTNSKRAQKDAGRFRRMAIALEAAEPTGLVERVEMSIEAGLPTAVWQAMYRLMIQALILPDMGVYGAAWDDQRQSMREAAGLESDTASLTNFTHQMLAPLDRSWFDKERLDDKPTKLSDTELRVLDSRYQSLLPVCKRAKRIHDQTYTAFCKARNDHSRKKWQEHWHKVAPDLCLDLYPQLPQWALNKFAESGDQTASVVAYWCLAQMYRKSPDHIKRLLMKSRVGSQSAKAKKAKRGPTVK